MAVAPGAWRVRTTDLRHRVTIQRNTETVDPATGYPTSGWAAVITDEPAQWLAGPGREYLAAEALRSSVSGRFIVRWNAANAAIAAGDRVLWDGRTMEIKAPPLPDETARKWLTLMVDDTDAA